MKKSAVIKGIMALMVTALLGYGVQVFAADTTGSDTAPGAMNQMEMSGKGYHGDHPMMGGYGSKGMGVNLTPEEMEKVQAERNAFLEATKDLRRDIRQKYLALQAEMAKKNPDKKTAKAIVKEISELNATLAEKRLDHQFNLKAINPDLGSNMGMGRYHHKGMGDPGDCPRNKK